MKKSGTTTYCRKTGFVVCNIPSSTTATPRLHPFKLLEKSRVFYIRLLKEATLNQNLNNLTLTLSLNRTPGGTPPNSVFTMVMFFLQPYVKSSLTLYSLNWIFFQVGAQLCTWHFFGFLQVFESYILLGLLQVNTESNQRIPCIF